MAAGVRGITKASSGRLSPKNEPGTDVFQDLGGLRAAVGGEVVQHHDVALVEGRGQLGFDMKVVEFSVHRPADHPRRVQPVMAQGGDEGLPSGPPSNRWRPAPRSSGRTERDQSDVPRAWPNRSSWPCWSSGTLSGGIDPPDQSLFPLRRR